MAGQIFGPGFNDFQRRVREMLQPARPPHEIDMEGFKKALLAAEQRSAAAAIEAAIEQDRIVKAPTLPKELMADLEKATPEHVAQMSGRAVELAANPMIRVGGQEFEAMTTTTAWGGARWGGGWGATATSFVSDIF